MRPRSECRLAIMKAAQSTDCATWRDLAAASGVGFDVAKQTVRDMVRAGELQIVGKAIHGGPGRPPNLVKLAERRREKAHACAVETELRELLQLWSRSEAA